LEATKLGFRWQRTEQFQPGALTEGPAFSVRNRNCLSQEEWKGDLARHRVTQRIRLHGQGLEESARPSAGWAKLES
jgi:hypothetical protein